MSGPTTADLSTTSGQNGALAKGKMSVGDELTAMNNAFQLGISTNEQITFSKTIDGAEETAAQQRPNIG